MSPALATAPADGEISILRGLDPVQVEAEYDCDLVYLIHLDRPMVIGRLVLRHYIGHAMRGRLNARQIQHRLGSGSKFLRLARQRGCTWHLARVWPGDYAEERRIKNMGGASRFCPSCGIVTNAERQKLRGPDGRYTAPGGSS